MSLKKLKCVTSHVFAEENHFVARPCGFALCGDTHDIIVIYIPSIISVTRSRNVAIPIALNTGFYN